MSIPSFFPIIHNEQVKTNKSIKVTNPFNGKAIAKVYLAEGEYLDLAIESALKGFEISKRFSSFERFQYLKKIADGIKARADDLVETIVKEAGKPIRFAKNEVTRAQLTFNWAAEESKRIGGEYIDLDIAPQTKDYFGLTRRFPLGVILGITPFNFPLNLVAHKIAPAIASGNSIILKPASQTPITAVKLGEIIQATGLPPGIVNILPASSKNAEILLKDARIKKLSFTGSAQIGWYLKTRSGKKRVTLELGGNAAAIVEPDGDLNQIIPRLVVGSFAYAGQVCISVQRIYVQNTIFDEFIQKFKDEIIKNCQVGDPFDEKTVVGPMINLEAAKRVQNLIKDAQKLGALVLIGGNRNNTFLEPTVLTKTNPGMKVVSEEIFAPVVVIESYDQFPDALNMVNNAYFGLQAAVFSNNFRKIQEAFSQLEVAGVIINDYPTFRIDPMPYGGIKDSGFGREGLRYAIEEMTELKLLVVKK
jgi:acyl-CoA reductase-like NAD-dependent aldehyde dehydrogenase